MPVDQFRSVARQCESIALSDTDWTHFHALGAAHVYSAGVQLFDQGSHADEIFFISSGLVKLVVSSTQYHEAIVAFRLRGGILGTEAALLGETHATAAITLTACKLHRVEISAFRDLLATDHVFSGKIHEVQSRELYSQLGHMSALMTLPANIRLNCLLKELVVLFGGDHTLSEGRRSLPIKFSELASFLAITPPYLSRLLNRLENSGILHRTGGCLVLSDSSCPPESIELRLSSTEGRRRISNSGDWC